MGAHPLGAARRPAANARLCFLMSFAVAAALGLGCAPAAAQPVKSGAAWDPGANNTVRALAMRGSTLYVGGVFDSVGGVARSRIAAVDVATGSAKVWDPGASGNVYALAVSGTTIYAGGAFTSIGG